MEHGGGMALAEVIVVLTAVRSTGCRYWLEGGWGVDALGGVTVPCVSIAAQRLFRSGHGLRIVDRLDLAQLERLSE